MDIALHYIEKGTGTPLILLHGNGESLAYFENQIEYFSAKYRVIAIDTRGHGKSPRGEAPFTIRQFAQDLRDFMDLHSIEKAHILGFSDGGNIALVFALKYPGRVERLILNGANLDASGVKPSVQLPIEAGYRIASLFAGRNQEARKHAELLGLMVNDPNIRREELKKLPVKTLVIAGTKDMIKAEHTRLIWESLPKAELVFLPGDHFIANKNAREFNAVVERFLEENDKN
ncbi:MAG: alpha/beta hydrolase [Lachnospiraceae bacterium]|nr:alpha/beta hydrolase [Lachnospiraceae bacterium]